jgi:phosphotransferase system  glucose/maltose/N-acetylglucosamine-specific IIC component
MTFENDKAPSEDLEVHRPVNSSENILNQLDKLIQRVKSVRKVFLAMSFSTIILAPLSIFLSIYLMLHPSFFKVLDSNNDFGYVLLFFLGLIISISLTWLVTGLHQYQALKSWNKRYANYLVEKDRIERRIASQYELKDED